jgi:hypothetical protein
MANTIQLRRGTASQWTSANTVLASGEVGFETDTNKFKIGTGTASWSELAYAAIDLSTASSLYLPLSGSVNWSNINDKPDLTITLSGDLTGSATFTDLASGTLTATIAANSVALGTDTTGDYVSGLTAGNGISITGTAGEGWSPTVSINSSTASVAFANITSKPTTLSGYGITDALPASASSSYGLKSGTLGQFASTTSSQLAGVISDETGSGALVFGTSPAITTSITTPSTSFDLFNTTATTINFGGAATTINVGSASARVKLLAGSVLEAPISTNAQAGTSYVIGLSDAGKLIEMNSASANTIIIPTNASVAFPVGTKIDFIQTGAGATSASPTSGVTLNSDTNKRTINAQWAAATLIKRGTDTWALIGALKA